LSSRYRFSVLRTQVIIQLGYRYLYPVETFFFTQHGHRLEERRSGITSRASYPERIKKLSRLDTQIIGEMPQRIF
jgi:hypothetical protein